MDSTIGIDSQEKDKLQKLEGGGRIARAGVPSPSPSPSQDRPRKAGGGEEQSKQGLDSIKEEPSSNKDCLEPNDNSKGATRKKSKAAALAELEQLLLSWPKVSNTGPTLADKSHETVNNLRPSVSDKSPRTDNGRISWIPISPSKYQSLDDDDSDEVC